MQKRIYRTASPRTLELVIGALPIGVLAGGMQALAWDDKNWEEQGPGPILAV
jgi:hypothetical protein